MVEPVAARFVVSNASYPERVQHAQVQQGELAQQHIAQEQVRKTERQRQQVQQTGRGEQTAVRPDDKRRRAGSENPGEHEEPEPEAPDHGHERPPEVAQGRIIDVVA